MPAQVIGTRQETLGWFWSVCAFCGQHSVEGQRKDQQVKAQGCVACIAASSVTTELCIGRTLDEALAIDKDVIADALDGVPPPKMVCSMICPTALRVAVEDFRAR